MSVGFCPKDVFELMTDVTKHELEILLPVALAEPNTAFLGWRVTNWKEFTAGDGISEYDEMYLIVYKGRTVSFIVDTRYWLLEDAPVVMVIGSGASTDVLLRTAFNSISGVIAGMLYLYHIWRKDGSPREYLVAASVDKAPPIASTKANYSAIPHNCIRLSVPEFDGDIVLVGKPITKLKVV